METSNYEGRYYSDSGNLKSPKRRRRPLWQLIVADILLAGISLCIFALFHHVIPQKGSAGTEIPGPDITVTSQIKNTSSSSSDELTDTGYFGDRFPDKFTSDGSVESTDNSYKNGNVNITVTQYNENDITYYVADVYVKRIEYLRTAFAHETYGKGYTQTITEMAENNSAIFAVNGDYYGNSSSRGTVIRNGKYYRGNTYGDTCILYRDGTMVTYSESEYNIDKVLENNPWQGWSFGPRLLDGNGKAMSDFNSNVKPKNPRTAIGYIEPGHYCFITVDGRQDGYSVGMTLKELSALAERLGCKAAYNLDGGQSAEMYFNGNTADRPYKGGRKQSDIVYIGTGN